MAQNLFGDYPGWNTTDIYLKGTYSAKPNNTGGVNYFRDGQPVTREIFRVGAGANPDDIESYAKQQFAAGQAGDSTAPSGSSAPSGGSAGPVAPVLDQGAIDATQAAINSLGTEKTVGYKNIEDSLASLTGKYDREAAKNKGDYDTSTVTNTTNLEKNKQNALVAAAQGRRGLRGTLASIGALSGTGGQLADRAVTTSANQDIGGAVDTYATNASSLDKALGEFTDEDKERRLEAQTNRNNQRTALEGSVASKRQQFYQKMAEIYKAADQTGAADDWLRKAGGLNEEIASKSAVQAAPFTPLSAAYTPKALSDYLAGAGDMTVGVGPTSSGLRTPTSIFAGPRRRREDELVPAVV